MARVPKDEIKGAVLEVRKCLDRVEALKESAAPPAETKKALAEMAERAHVLHQLVKPNYPHDLLTRAKVSPDLPEFYRQPHLVAELVRYVEQAEQNGTSDDPTLGCSFPWEIFAERAGETVRITLERTPTGWRVKGKEAEGDTDKGGRPFLYTNLNRFRIDYPATLVDNLMDVWDQAYNEHLTSQEVQELLYNLALPITLWEKLKKIKRVTTDKRGAVTFLDVLGWKGIWQRNRHAVGNLLELVSGIEKRSDGMTEVKSISDTIAIFTEGEPVDAITLHGELCSEAICMSIRLGIPLRGATAYGEFSTNANIMVGPAVDEAASWHENTDWIGVILTPSAALNVSAHALPYWIEKYTPPLKGGAKFDTRCLNWCKQWPASKSYVESEKELIESFLNMGPLDPAISPKYTNTLQFFRQVLQP